MINEIHNGKKIEAEELLKLLDISGCGLPEHDGLLLLEQLTEDSTLLPSLKTLGLGGDHKNKDQWQDAVELFYTSRPNTKVFWTM